MIIKQQPRRVDMYSGFFRIVMSKKIPETGSKRARILPVCAFILEIPLT
jgi:hypothetical protein